MGHVEVAKVTHTLPDGRVLLDEASFRVADGAKVALVGVEAVIDKDRSSSVLAKDLDADLLVIATDTDAVYLDWGTPQQRAIATASPDAIEAFPFPAGSMGPKVEAAADFARSRPGKVAVIGALADITAILAGTKGTRISTDANGFTVR